MRSLLTTLTFGGSLFALVMVATLSPKRVHSAPPGQITLMQTLSEWMYPGSKLHGVASMSDGGIPPMQAVKCEAILTTPDSIEKVIAFYAEKLKRGASSGPGATKKKDSENSVSVQDDSKGRPVTLRVIVVNRVDTSTTLVLSRSEGEKETHIVWSHSIRISAGDPQVKGADDRMRFSLNIHSGRVDPSWNSSDEEVKKFTAKFDELKAREVQQPLHPALGYRGFSVDGFRSYDRIWVWKGTAEATRDGKTYQWDDEGKALEKYLLEVSKPHLSDREYKIAVGEAEKK